MNKPTVGRLVAVVTGMLALAFIVPMAQAGHATIVNYVVDQELTLNGTEMKIMAGSVQQGLDIGDTSLTVNVPNDEIFLIRTLGPQPRALESDSTLPACNVLQNRDNQIRVQGPKTVTFTPSQLTCDTTNYSQDDTPFIRLTNVEAGATYQAGDQHQLFWQTEGQGTPSVRIRLSVDDGSSFDRGVVVGLLNNGYFNWTVPEVYTTNQARLKIEGTNGQNQVLSASISPAFTIEGLEPPPAEQVWDFDPASVTATAISIDQNQGFTVPEGGSEPDCVGLRLKLTDDSAVYYCGMDGQRHVFPNQDIHASWYGAGGNWGGVVEVSPEYLASLPLGANITYRPGVRMVKITTDPKTYVVAPGSILRWVPSEEAAIALYGTTWSQQIDDLPDAFFTDYVIGEPLQRE